MLEPWLCRAARAALGWSRERLAEESGVSTPTIQRFERGEIGLYETVRKLRTALERGGVEFIEMTKDRGPGLTLRHGRKS
jgi:transcriptional regulator with XRE-family HTH domain